MQSKIQNLNFKPRLSNFLVWSGIIMGTIVIISELILAMLMYQNPKTTMPNPHGLWTPNNVWVAIWNSLSTFSMQSIILVTIYFYLVLTNQIYPHRAKFVNGPFALAITVYATITMFVFWSTLFKPMLNQLNSANTAQITGFVFTFFLHLFLPLIIISHYLITSGVQKWKTKKILTSALPLTLSYMLLYLAYVLIKGSYMGIVKTTNGKAIIDYSYPYPFLNFKNSITNFLIYFFAILIVFIILYTLYFAYNNWKNKQISKTILVNRSTDNLLQNSLLNLKNEKIYE